MTAKYGYALHELQFVSGDEKVTVAPGSTFSFPEEIYNDFVKLNAVRPATKDEITVAEAKGSAGVTKTVAADPKADAAAAKVESAKADAKKADAKASEAAAAETDRNREAAKQAAAATKSDPLA